MEVGKYEISEGASAYVGICLDMGPRRALGPYVMCSFRTVAKITSCAWVCGVSGISGVPVVKSLVP